MPILFFITAFLYACVGFGGGSTYNALLVLGEVDYKIIPLVSLLCNIIVVSGGVFHFLRKEHFKVNKVFPWVVVSVPAAWLGGYIPVPEIVFVGILGCMLLVSGVWMLWPARPHEPCVLNANDNLVKNNFFLPPLVGGVLGFVSGITGIGGGIFLAPVLHILRWNDPKNIAGTCSLFILVNSLSGIVGQVMKMDKGEGILFLTDYWSLFIVVLLGGQLGAWLGAGRINAQQVKKMTALLILYVAVRLLLRFAGMTGFV